MIQYIFPFPPSVNSLYFQGKTHGQKFLSKKGREYKKMLFDLYSNDDLNPITEDIIANIVIIPPDNRIRDLDNYIKPILDGLKYLEVIQDDSQIKTLTTSIVPPIPKYNKGFVLVQLKHGTIISDSDFQKTLESKMALIDKEDLIYFIKDSKAYQKRVGGL